MAKKTFKYKPDIHSCIVYFAALMFCSVRYEKPFSKITFSEFIYGLTRYKPIKNMNKMYIMEI